MPRFRQEADLLLATPLRTRLSIVASAFKLSLMKHRAMRLGLALMGIGILSALPLAYFSYEVLAGGAFIAGMLLLWIGAAVTFTRRLGPANRNGS